MRYYSLYARDTRSDNWIFRHANDVGVTLNEDYADLRCPKCKKIDELKALKRGLGECQIRERKADFFASHEGMSCVSLEFKQCLEAAGVRGLEYYAAPNAIGRSVFVIVPTLRVKAKKSAFKFGKKCPACRRFKTVYGAPSTEQIELPQSAMTILTTDVSPEKEAGLMFQLMTGEDVVKLLKDAGLKGVLAFRTHP